MATIVCDAKRLVFVHIPKCAGQTVSKQLREVVDYDPTFDEENVFDHPALGPIQPAHLPLAVLRDHFPETFAKYLAYTCYTVIREPTQRFVSSVAQHLRTTRHADINALSKAELEETFDRIFTALTGPGETIPIDFVHFTRQVDYIFLDGRKIVDNIYSVPNLQEFAQDLRRKHGIGIDGQTRKNVTRGYRSLGIKRAMRAGGAVASALLPRTLFYRVRRAARQVAISTDAAAPEAFASPEAQAFLRDFYAADFALWAAEIHRASGP